MFSDTKRFLILVCDYVIMNKFSHVYSTAVKACVDYKYGKTYVRKGRRYFKFFHKNVHGNT